MARAYDVIDTEKKWQRRWREEGTYEVDADDPRPPWYVLSMYPYPSGAAHMGHVRNYTFGDLLVRHRTMLGYAVLSPFGFDSFGLPAENAAIKTGTHPRIFTDARIEELKESITSLGAVYDCRREVRSHDPEYIKWNQVIITRFLEAGLAYRANAPVNWCPGCKTVLANEQVLADGTCERSGDVVDKRDLEQWFLGITRYADELLDGLDGLAAGLGLITAMAICIYSVGLLRDHGGDVLFYPPAVISVVLAGACLGFLPHNFHPARIFMGDSGSMLIGLMLAAAATTAAGPISQSAYGARDVFALLSPFLLVAAVVFVPALDMLLAIVRRTRAGRSPFSPDKMHLHHRLLQIGHSHRRAVLLIYLWVGLVALGVASTIFFDPRYTGAVMLVAVAIAVVVTVIPLIRGDTMADDEELTLLRDSIYGRPYDGR